MDDTNLPYLDNLWTKSVKKYNLKDASMYFTVRNTQYHSLFLL